MNFLMQGIADAANKSSLSTLTSSSRKDIATAMLEWVANTSNTRCPDFAIRLETMRTRIESMSERLRIVFEENRFVIKVSGLDQETFQMLKNGTDWFMPHPDVVSAIVAVNSKK